MSGRAGSLVLFGDTVGLPRLLGLIDAEAVSALVRAEIRPEQRGELESLASQRGLPLLEQPRADSDEYAAFVSELASLEPELLLVDSYSMLLRPDVLALPRGGAFNVHGALLPQYRGPNPIQWALINRERETGVTIHHLSEGLDAGDIVAQERVPILIGDTWLDVQERIAAASEGLLEAQLPAILAGTAPRIPQDEALAHRYPRRGREDGRFDWDFSVRRIYDLVRALVRPHPGAHYAHEGEEVVLDRYLTLAEVAALKYAGPGGLVLGDESLRLEPDGSEPGNERIVFHAVAVQGRGRVELQLDWDRGRAGIGEPAALKRDSRERAALLLEGFSGSELGLDWER